jgi:hypothetical protein
MIFRLQQFLESVDLSFLFLDFRIGCSVGRQFRCDIEVLRAPIALPRGVRFGVSCPCALQTSEDDRRRRTQIA